MDSPRTSWALAAWVVPVVPMVWFLAFGLLDLALGVGAAETSAYAWGTVLALSFAATGAVLLPAGRTRQPSSASPPVSDVRRSHAPVARQQRDPVVLQERLPS